MVSRPVDILFCGLNITDVYYQFTALFRLHLSKTEELFHFVRHGKFSILSFKSIQFDHGGSCLNDILKFVRFSTAANLRPVRKRNILMLQLLRRKFSS